MLGEISAGAGGPVNSDLAIATRFAIDIETTYGLGLHGPVWHSKPDADHLATPAVHDRVRRRVQRAEKRAAAILMQNQYFLDTLARRLVETRSMKASEIGRLLDGVVTEREHPQPMTPLRDQICPEPNAADYRPCPPEHPDQNLTLRLNTRLIQLP